MAAIAIVELFEDRSGTASIGFAQSIRTYSRTFRVTTNNKYDGIATAGSATGLPRIGDKYPEDTGSWCRSVDVEQLAGSTIWKVKCTYSSEFEVTTSPLTDPAVITWSAEQFQRPAWKDRDGNAILNSAGQFFDTLPTVDDSRFVVAVQKNVGVVPSWVATYQDALNSVPFTVDGITVGTKLAKLNGLKIGSWQERAGVAYRSLQYELHLRREGWDLQILDQGRLRKGRPTPTADEVGFAGEETHKPYPAVVSGTGQDSSEPMLLDGNGAQLIDPTPANAVFLSFGYYHLVDFNNLPLS